MGISQQLTNEGAAWGVLAILLVIFMVILGAIKTSGDAKFICFGTTPYFNATGNICCQAANRTAPYGDGCDAANSTAIATAGTTVDDFITGLSEPKNWLAIFFIALIGFGIIKFVKSRNG